MQKKKMSWQEMVWGFSGFDAHLHPHSILFSFSIFFPDQLPSFVKDSLTNHSAFLLWFPGPIPDLICIQISSYLHSHFYFFLYHHYSWNSSDSFPSFSVMVVIKQLKLILLLLSFQFPLYFLFPCSGDGNILILNWSESTELIPNCQDTDFK